MAFELGAKKDEIEGEIQRLRSERDDKIASIMREIDAIQSDMDELFPGDQPAAAAAGPADVDMTQTGGSAVAADPHLRYASGALKVLRTVATQTD